MGVGTIELASHPISAFDDVSETFITIAMLKAPLIGIPDRQVRIRGLIRTHLKQFSEIDHGEKERFIEGITDLFSSRMTTDRINEISKKIGDIDRLGKIIDSVQDNYSRLSISERLHYLSIASETMIRNLEELEERLAIETISSDDEQRFQYLLISQTIIHAVLRVLKDSLSHLDAQTDGTKEKRINDIMSLALFSIVRVEAFRRGKIDTEGLRDTLSLIVAASTLEDFSPTIELPEEGSMVEE